MRNLLAVLVALVVVSVTAIPVFAEMTPAEKMEKTIAAQLEKIELAKKIERFRGDMEQAAVAAFNASVTAFEKGDVSEAGYQLKLCKYHAKSACMELPANFDRYEEVITSQADGEGVLIPPVVERPVSKEYECPQ